MGSIYYVHIPNMYYVLFSRMCTAPFRSYRQANQVRDPADDRPNRVAGGSVVVRKCRGIGLQALGHIYGVRGRRRYGAL